MNAQNQQIIYSAFFKLGMLVRNNSVAT